MLWADFLLSVLLLVMLTIPFKGGSYSSNTNVQIWRVIEYKIDKTERCLVYTEYNGTLDPTTF